MKKLTNFLSIAAIILIACLMVSCDDKIIEGETSDSTTISGTSDSNGNVQNTTSYTANGSGRDITLDTYDEMPELTTFTNITVDLTAKTVDGKTISTDSTKTEVSKKIKFKFEDSLVKITADEFEGNLSVTVSGTISDYGLQIKGNPSYCVKVILNGVSITSGTTPCLILNTEGTSYVVLEGSNTLTDGRSYGTGYSEEDEGEEYYTSSFTGTPDEDAEETVKFATGNNSKGTLYSKGPIIFSGDGSLTVTEGYKHAIASKDYIKVNSGTFTINSTGRNGFQAVNGFIMNDGNITINGTGNNTNNQSRGIVVEGAEDKDNPGEGFIVINDGTLKIDTVSKGMTAKWDIEEDFEDEGTNDTSNDPYPYVRITGGTIDIVTRGKPEEETSKSSFTDADGVTVSEAIKLAPEGIEGKQAVFIEGGDITLNCTDDCINASRSGSAKIVISGGKIYAKSYQNDAIDSNGTLTISGGTVVAIAMTTPECAFDADSYTFAITGGFVAGIGTSNYTNPTPSACNSQGVLVLASSYLGSAGKTIAIKDSDGDVVYAFTVPSGLSLNDAVGIFSCPDLTNSDTYSLVTGATATNGSASDGLYTSSMPSVSGGNSYTGLSFASSYVYTAGTTNNQGAQDQINKPGNNNKPGAGWGRP